MKIKATIFIVFVVAAAVGAFLYFRGGEEGKVRKQFERLAFAVSKEPGEGNISMALKMETLPTLFADSCDVEIPQSPLIGQYSPEEITSNATRARMHFSSLTLKFYDMTVEFPEKDRARVEFTARLTGSAKGEKAVDEVREIAGTLRKIDKKWLFDPFRVVEVLKK